MIPFIDLAAQQNRIRAAIDRRIAAVLDHGGYIMGPEVREFEAALAGFCGAGHVLSCANGTDALSLALAACDIGAGDAVFCPSFTFAATAEVVPGLGATPVFVDIEPKTYNIDPASLARAIDHSRDLGLRPAAVIPVDLFGLPANYTAIEPVARAAGMSLIADAAQSFGARVGNAAVGRLGDITTTSFFPAKPLGCYGDGGALFTDDDGLAERIASLRVHGKGSDKYDNVRIGMNSRLDTVQAAILLEKLAVFPDEIERRNRIAARYSEALASDFTVPHLPDGSLSVWAQYTLRARSGTQRAAIMAGLADQGIPSMIYYRVPLHRQTAYARFPTDPEGLPESEHAADTVFSLPMHPYLEAEIQDRIIDALLAVILDAGR